MAKRKSVREKSEKIEQVLKKIEPPPTTIKKNSIRLLKKRLVMQKLRQSLTYRKKDQIRNKNNMQEKRKVIEYRLRG